MPAWEGMHERSRHLGKDQPHGGGLWLTAIFGKVTLRSFLPTREIGQVAHCHVALLSHAWGQDSVRVLRVFRSVFLCGGLTLGRQSFGYRSIFDFPLT